MANNDPSDYTTYRKCFSPAAMWDKVSAYARKAGMELVYAVLLLYYVATDQSTPKADRARIYGAIGYFILPIDVMPDAIPIVGLSDDMAVLLWALKAVWDNVTPEIRDKARCCLVRWFGSVDNTRLRLVDAQARSGNAEK